MSITELPHTTISAIGSTSALSDPCSVAKELIDNALDANATSVSVEISQNSLDVLQVRDNGLGIQSEDRELVCKPSYTSKIQSLEDLRNVSHRYLGFRGLALASIAEMSAAVVVTTKVEGEPVGFGLKYDRTGNVLSRERIAHPVGTTVRVSEFLKYLPVRRKTILKSSSSIAVKIKKLLQSYAMARPEIRLSLKVLGGKQDSSWIYPAKQGASVMDAISKIAGSEVASQCITKVAEVREPGETDIYSSVDHAGIGDDTIPRLIRITATIPRADSDFHKVSRSGQYVSVDGRPLSSEKGVAKSFVKLYKSYIRSTSPAGHAHPTIVDPFLCLLISLPPGSCDVNVEPAKDDVLLSNNSLVLSTVEGLFKEEYESRVGTSPTNTENALENRESDEIACLGSSHNGSPRRTISSEGGRRFSTSNNLGLVSPTFRPLASPDTESTRGGTTRADPLKQTGQAGRTKSGGASRSLHAWNEPHGPHSYDEPLRQQSTLQLRTPMRGGNLSHLPSAGTRPQRPPNGTVRPFLPSPVDSSAGSPLTLAQRATDNSNRKGARRGSMEAHKESGSNGTLDNWIRGSPLHTTSPRNPNQVAPNGESEDAEQLADIDFDGRFGRGLTDDVGSNLSPLHRQSQRLASLSTESVACTSGLSRPSASEFNQDSTQDPQRLSQMAAVEEALEFERRKKQVNQYKRQMLNSPASTHGPSRDSPCRSFECAPARGGHPATVSLAQHSTARTLSSQAKTTPSTHLPLEKISEDCAIHHLSTTLPYTSAKVKSLAVTLSTVDRYIRAGDVSYDLSQRISRDITGDWKLTLLEIIRRECASDTDDFGSMVAIDLDSVLERHRSLHEA